MNNNNNAFLSRYIPLIDFFEELLGLNSEIVLHDLKNLDSSIIAIRNNHITKRQVGDPATDYVLRMVQEGIDHDDHYAVNYRTISNRDNQKIKSASYFIRKDKQIVGMICVNTDVTLFEEIEKSINTLDLLVETYQKSSKKPTATQETASRSVEEMAENVIMSLAVKKGISINQFRQEDKFDAIESLHNNGFFLLKGAVPEASKILKISEPTVYRYLQTIRGN